MSVGKIPLWLDCDPGHDDAFAILLAGHHEAFRLLGVSTVAGNAPLDKTTNNALSVLQAFGIDDVRVHKGSSGPFCRPFNSAPDIHGESGLDGTDLLPQPNRKALTTCHAIQDMHDALMATPPQTAWLIATGPFTNIALLFAVYPEVARHIRGLSLMGGAVGNGYTNVYMGPGYADASGNTQPRIGNVTPFAEFNVWCDAESAQSVFMNPELQSKTLLIPLDLTHQACATKAIRETLLSSKGPHRGTSRLRRMINDLLMFFAQTYDTKFGLADGPPLHDPLAIAVVLAQEFKSDGNAFDDSGGERWAVEVVLEGAQLGRTLVKPAERGILIPRSFDNDAFWRSIECALARADEATGYIPCPSP